MPSEGERRRQEAEGEHMKALESQVYQGLKVLSLEPSQCNTLKWGERYAHSGSIKWDTNRLHGQFSLFLGPRWELSSGHELCIIKFAGWSTRDIQGNKTHKTFSIRMLCCRCILNLWAWSWNQGWRRAWKVYGFNSSEFHYNYFNTCI